MARARTPDTVPDAAPETAAYVAVDVFHHPDGVATPGDVVELTSEAAARGVASGVLVPTQIVPQPTETAAPAGEE